MSNFKTNKKLTKADVGLGSVDNTADLNKPISTLVQQALEQKAWINHNHDTAYAKLSDVEANFSRILGYTNKFRPNPSYSEKWLVNFTSADRFAAWPHNKMLIEKKEGNNWVEYTAKKGELPNLFCGISSSILIPKNTEIRVTLDITGEGPSTNHRYFTISNFVFYTSTEWSKVSIEVEGESVASNTFISIAKQPETEGISNRPGAIFVRIPEITMGIGQTQYKKLRFSFKITWETSGSWRLASIQAYGDWVYGWPAPVWDGDYYTKLKDGNAKWWNYLRVNDPVVPEDAVNLKTLSEKLTFQNGLTVWKHLTITDTIWGYPMLKLQRGTLGSDPYTDWYIGANNWDLIITKHLRDEQTEMLRIREWGLIVAKDGNVPIGENISRFKVETGTHTGSNAETIYFVTDN